MRKQLLLLFACIQILSYGQEIQLKSGTFPIQEIKDIRTNFNVEEDKYVIVSFNSIPSSEEKKILQENGLILFDYLPQNSFYAQVSANINFSNNIFSSIYRVISILPKYKLSKELSEGIFPAHAMLENDKIDLICHYFPGSTFSINSLQIIKQERELNQITLRVSINDFPHLIKTKAFYYIEEIPDVSVPENKVERTNHRSNFLRSYQANGLFYRGDNVTVMMQDDGIIGPHIDFTGRTDQSNCSGCSTSASQSHGDHVAGTIMGAGNLDPATRGMADGVKLLVYNSSNGNFSAVPALYNSDSLVITSKSYGDGCNNGYTSLARQLDQQVRQMPALSHVFSAGNSGTQNCGYGAGSGWGNITGGHKSAKNVYAVGNLTKFDVIANSSSRGPSEDGRIKPDICAVGTSVNSTQPDNTYGTKTGTSMACPGVAGVLAQLYDAYRDDFGSNPHSSLIKACVLNGAEDLGNIGPDYTYGWGRINAKKSYEIFHNNQFIYDSITQGATKNHTITVPAGVKELKVMVYWMDYEASTSAATALVNDIDMQITDPSSTVFLPWLLDPTPNAIILNTPATNGADHLNNMEQIVINNPQTGNYTVNLNGFAIPQGPQKYYLVYSYIFDEITVTYPNGGEPFEPSTSEVVRWDAQKGNGLFTVEYSIDAGVTWNLIGTTTGDKLYYNWSVPNVLTGKALVRVTQGSISDVSDTVFSIIDVPNNLDFSWSCPDSSKLTWDAVPGAISYEISMLGGKYMDSIGTSSTNNFTVLQPSSSTDWYSVKAIGPDNAISERHIAIQKSGNEFACLWSTPTALFTLDCYDAGEHYCVTLNNQSVNADATSNYSWYFPNGTPSTSNDMNPTVCFPSAGDYDVALVVDNGFATDSVYLTDNIHIASTKTIPYFEGFENYSNFLNLDEWSTNSPGNNIAWTVNSQAGLNSNQSAKLNNYAQNGNFIDELISGPIDLSVLSPTTSMTLSFRYSYRKRIATNDEWLRVYIRENCASNWALRKTLHGNQLSVDVSVPNWTPSSESDWTTVHMTNVTNAYFSNDFRFKFSFESDQGNSIYIDNINIYEGSPSDEIVLVGLEENTINELEIYPNPADNELIIRYDISNNQSTNISILDVTGKVFNTVKVNSIIGSNLVFIDLSTLSSGIYFVVFENNGEEIVRKIVVR